MRVQPPDPKADRFRLSPRGARRPLAERDANVIPLIDVVFILILYFMLAGNLDPNLTEALAPPQSASTTHAPLDVPTVLLDGAGRVRYEGLQVDDTGLAAALVAGGRPPARVALRADATADSARVADLVAIVSAAGVGDLSLITVPVAPAGR